MVNAGRRTESRDASSAPIYVCSPSPVVRTAVRPSPSPAYRDDILSRGTRRPGFHNIAFNAAAAGFTRYRSPGRKSRCQHRDTDTKRVATPLSYCKQTATGDAEDAFLSAQQEWYD